MWAAQAQRARGPNGDGTNRDTADVYTGVRWPGRAGSQLGGVNPRVVRDAQSQSAVKQQDLTIDKAEDQLRGTTGRRRDATAAARPSGYVCVEYGST